MSWGGRESAISLHTPPTPNTLHPLPTSSMTGSGASSPPSSQLLQVPAVTIKEAGKGCGMINHCGLKGLGDFLSKRMKRKDWDILSLHWFSDPALSHAESQVICSLPSPLPRPHPGDTFQALSSPALSELEGTLESTHSTDEDTEIQRWHGSCSQLVEEPPARLSHLSPSPPPPALRDLQSQQGGRRSRICSCVIWLPVAALTGSLESPVSQSHPNNWKAGP